MEQTLRHIAIRKQVANYALLTNKRADPITYTLAGRNSDSTGYYDDVAHFTEMVLAKSEARILPIVKQFEAYIRETALEPLCTSSEYVLEALTLGVLWHVYAAQAMHFSPTLSGIFHGLIALRRRYRWLKPVVDKIRGILTTLFLAPRRAPQFQSHPWEAAHVKTLLDWLALTGEFHEEVKRLRVWQRFFKAKSSDQTADMLERLTAFALWFEPQARKALGVYTQQVEHFLRHTYPRRYRWREDVIFCGRQEVEYHLIMVGAEILNRALRADFQETPRKAVLLPTCMRSRPAVECRARQDGFDLTCAGCSAHCRINQLTQLGQREGFDVFLIPHSSDFTRWLERWRDTREVGVVGVACVLNLFTGGYEMKDLNIPSQCVLLDYCGCKNHWHADGVPTDINTQELLRLLHTHTISANQAYPSQG